ncbi:conserved Plasmodium protein, unknown function [Plasmodium gallinaceum]|uniref:Uncharacterized protein n=1 Tax=Plasmodium gallinaceum TaxID=5849 RepID=A0A1J1GPQ0_PLAGA|nr:conserved Plasmodium protein, unknown function [Plasmodium gallinaceum]CRG94276.1 conserved Plasmodium protein, unknown function [Plasmodium gallinaceum]
MNNIHLSIYIFTFFLLQIFLKNIVSENVTSIKEKKSRSSSTINTVESLVENILDVVQFLEDVNNYVIDFKKEMLGKLELLVHHDSNLYETYEYNENILNQIYSYNESKLKRYYEYIKNVKTEKLKMFNDTIDNFHKENIFYLNFIYKNLLTKIDLISDLNKKELNEEKKKNLMELTEYFDSLKKEMLKMQNKFNEIIEEEYATIKNANINYLKSLEVFIDEYLRSSNNFDAFSSYVINDFLLSDKKINVLNYDNNSFFKSNFMSFNFLFNFIKEIKNEKNFNVYIYLKDPIIEGNELSYLNYYVVIDLNIIDVIIKNVEIIKNKNKYKKKEIDGVLICIDNYIVKYNILSSNVYLDMQMNIKPFFHNKKYKEYNYNKIKEISQYLEKQYILNYKNTVFNDDFYKYNIENTIKDNEYILNRSVYIKKKNIFFDSEKEYYKKFLSLYTYGEILNIVCNKIYTCNKSMINTLNEINKNTFVLESHLKLKNELKKFFELKQNELLKYKGKEDSCLNNNLLINNSNNYNNNSDKCYVDNNNIFNGYSCLKSLNTIPISNKSGEFINMDNIDDYLNTYYVSYQESFKVSKKEQYYSILYHIFESYINNIDSDNMKNRYPNVKNKNISINYLGVLPEIIKVYKTFKYCDSLYTLANSYIEKIPNDFNIENEIENENSENEQNNENDEITDESNFLKKQNQKYMLLFQRHLQEEIKFINFFEILVKKKLGLILEENEYLKLYIFYGKKNIPNLPFTPLFFSCRTIIKVEVLRDVDTKQIIYSSRSFFLETLVTLKEYKIKNESAYITIETSNEKKSTKKRLKMDILNKISPMSQINAYIISSKGREKVYHKGNVYQRSATDIKHVISDIRNDFLNIILPQYNLFDLFDNYVYIIICLKNENC